MILISSVVIYISLRELALRRSFLLHLTKRIINAFYIPKLDINEENKIKLLIS